MSGSARIGRLTRWSVPLAVAAVVVGGVAAPEFYGATADAESQQGRLVAGLSQVQGGLTGGRQDAGQQAPHSGTAGRSGTSPQTSAAQHGGAASTGMSGDSGTSTYSGGLRYGWTVEVRSGETALDAVNRQIRQYGRGVVRLYSNDVPKSWSSITGLIGSLPTAYSFKVLPQQVLTGKYDATLSAWFRGAPTSRSTWWSYMPEPEDDIAAGRYTAAQFRSAWARIDGLASRANNPRLFATLMIMCWTVNPLSRRNWRDYYPGSAYVDNLSFDCQNTGLKTNSYTDPATLLYRPRDLARSLGKPWSLGEFESQLMKGDSGANRGAWLVGIARYAQGNGGVFATYYDALGPGGQNFRLLDTPSKQAWRSCVFDQVA